MLRSACGNRSKLSPLIIQVSPGISLFKLYFIKVNQPLYMQDDEQLMLLAKAGDLSAFNTLVRRHWRKAWRTAYYFLNGSADAEDVAQEAFVKIFAALPRYKSKAAFATYLYRVVSRLCFDRNKKKQPFYTDQLPDTYGNERNGFETIADNEDDMQIRRAIDSLPPDQRLAIILRYYEGLGYTGIADALGKTRKGAERLLARARNNLARMLYEE